MSLDCLFTQCDLGKLGKPDALPLLQKIELTKREEVRVRIAAIEAISSINAANPSLQGKRDELVSQTTIPTLPSPGKKRARPLPSSNGNDQKRAKLSFSYQTKTQKKKLMTDYFTPISREKRQGKKKAPPSQHSNGSSPTSSPIMQTTENMLIQNKGNAQFALPSSFGSRKISSNGGSIFQTSGMMLSTSYSSTLSSFSTTSVNFGIASEKSGKGVVAPLPSVSEFKPALSTINMSILSREQKFILKTCLVGKSVFFTGAAGTGKTYLLKQIVKSLRSKHNPKFVYVTAPTGIAACNIGGCTLHSFSGIGLGKESKEKLVTKVLSNSQARQRWLTARVLVIDEISMVSDELFDKLEYIARRVRNNNSPFGGIQIILTGDFFQLPPVQK